MKKAILLSTVLLALAGLVTAGCKKSSCESGKKAAALKAGAQKELGVEPQVSIALNLTSLKKSSLYGLLKKKVADKNLGADPCGQEMMDAATGMAILAHSPNNFKDENKNDMVVAVLLGMDADKAIACIKKSPKLKAKKATVNGKTYDAFESDQTTVYLFKATDKAIVIGTEAAMKKLVPGKGMLGRGDIGSFLSDRTISFKVGAVAGKINSLAGFIDVADGVSFNITAALVEQAMAEKAEDGFKGAKNFPGMDILRKISLDRSGKTLTVKGDVSRADLEGLMKNPMLGSLMKK